uniref:Sodium/nucleoside cotransporter n=1 Tax=Amphiprion ocellaris TaxID=80972 RepID=A0AAQ5ZC38_AMPOC
SAEQNGVQLKNVSQGNGTGNDNLAFDLGVCIAFLSFFLKKIMQHDFLFFSRFLTFFMDYNETVIFISPRLDLILTIFSSAGYVAYFIAACVLDFKRATALVVLTCLAVAAQTFELVKKYQGKRISRCFKPLARRFKSNLRWLKWVFILVVVVLLVVWLVLDTSKRPEQLISFGGVCAFVLLLFLFSAHRTAISWRPVFWGLGLQFCIGLFVIRTEPGFIAFDWLGTQVQTFLNYTTSGSHFVFGDLIHNIFAFQALPIVIFFSSVMSVLYYLGIMQWVILKISWAMQITLGTSATETLSVAGSIFIGQTEAPLLIRPYLKDMTKSEIHAVMTGGFATIAGSVMGAFISFGIDASALISASVMAAPCTLAISKLSYPETEKSKFSKTSVKVAAGDEGNILEAVSSGASASIGLVANIAASLISFLAILAFINSALSWLGGMVGYPEVTFKVRSETITTYALCGFANFSSLGVVIGGLSSICPSRRGDISALVLRAMITGTCVSLVNACIAGILFVPSPDCVGLFKESVFNASDVKIQTCCNDLFDSAVNNGTSVIFEGAWSTVVNVTTFFSNCCQCCDLSNLAVCH